MEDAAVDSKRANTVYGLNDGIARFIFEILQIEPTESGCIASKRIKEFADETDVDTHKGCTGCSKESWHRSDDRKNLPLESRGACSWYTHFDS